MRFKSYLVGRGFRQSMGVDGDTFSPVARYDSARLLLAIIAAQNFELRQFDISIAFLSDDNGETYIWNSPKATSKGSTRNTFVDFSELSTDWNRGLFSLIRIYAAHTGI